MELPKLTINPEATVYSTNPSENHVGHFFSDTKKIEPVSFEKIDLKDSEAHFQAATIQDHVITMIAHRCGEHEEIGEFVSMLKEISANNLKLAAVALKDRRYSEVKTFTANIAKAANAAYDYEAQLDQEIRDEH